MLRFFFIFLFTNFLLHSLPSNKNLFSKSLSEEINKINENPKRIRENKRNLSHLSVLYIYQEEFEKSFKVFQKIFKASPKEPISLFYMAYTRGFSNLQEAVYYWNKYLLLKTVQANRKVWLDLGILVKSIISNNVNYKKNKKQLLDAIFFFYFNQAYYTSMLNIALFEKYFLDENSESYQDDLNLVVRIKAGILTKIKYNLDAIKLYEKYKKEFNINDNNLVKLGILYFRNDFPLQALETFREIKNPKEQNFFYEYFLALTYKELKDETSFKSTREIARGKIKMPNHQKLFDKLSYD